MAWLRRLTFPALLVVSLALLLIGSNSGIWDPWEMNKAHLAQQVAGQSKVLVVDRQGELLSVLQEQTDAFFLVGITPPEMPALPGRKAPEGPSVTVRLLKQVESRLDSEVFHAVVLQGDLLMADPIASAATLDSLSQRAPGALVLVTAPKEGSCDALQEALNLGITQEAVRSLKETWKLWPADQNHEDLAKQQAGSFPFSVALQCTDDADQGLPDLLAQASAYPWTRVVYKGLSEPKSKDTPAPAMVSWSAPPLDYWMMGLSFRALGFSETSARLPSLLMGLGTLLLLFLFLRRLASGKEALVAALALLSIPLFWGQSKNLMGESSYVFFLTLSVLVLAWMDQRGFTWKSLLGLAGAALGLLLAKGLFGLLVLVVISGTLHLGMGEWKRTRTLLPLALLAGMLVLVTAAVQFPTEWTFLDHFKFMSHGFLGGPQLELRTYDYLIRNVSFALLPMAVLVPFALFRMLPHGDQPVTDRSRLEVLTFLWFAIPFGLQTALMPSFAQAQFPAVPAAALALALMWSREETEGTNRFQAMVLLAIGMMLMANVMKSPAPIFNLLTGDPHFAGEDGGSLKFPAEYSMGMAVNLLFLAIIALLFFYYIRGGDLYKTVVRFFQRPKPYFWAVWVAILAVAGRIAAGLVSRFDMATTGKAAAKVLPDDITFVQELLFRRPESWMVYTTFGALTLVALWRYTGLGGFMARVFRFAAKPASACTKGVVWMADSLIGFGLALGLGLAAVLDALFTMPAPDGFWAAFATRPLVIVALAAPVVTAGVALLWKHFGNLTGRMALRMVLSAVTLGFWLVAGAVHRQTDMNALDLPILMMASFVLLALCWLPLALSDSQRFRRVVLAATAVGMAALVLPLLVRWPSLELRAFPNSDSPYLHYLFLESRTTFGVVALLLLVILNRLFPVFSACLRAFGTKNGTRPCMLDRMGLWNPAFWPEALQTRKVFLPLILTLGVAAGALFSVVVLPSFSREVSQKHILELYYNAEEREDLGDNIFKYQKGGGTASEDLNFYTAPLPELAGQSDLTRVLLANQDALVKVNRSPSNPGPAYVLVRGFDAANDKNGDGQRDVEADAGVATSIEGLKVVDTTKAWAENAWKDKLFIDWKGNTIPIVSNDATTLTLAAPPAQGMGNEESRRYVLDSAEAANHQASAQTQARNYVVVGQEGFSTINFTFREQSSGVHIPVLDGSNASFLMATSYLREGEQNQNRFAQATMTKEQMASVQLKGGWINFNDQIRFLGYTIDTPQVGRNEKLTVRLYWEVLSKVDTSWKIFLHMDSVGSSNRIHGDHWPLSLSTDPEEKDCVGCWRTNHWRPGDIIVDEFKTDIPLGTPGGQYTMNMGLYTPGSDKRLKVKEVQKGQSKNDGNDRVYIGTFEVN